MEFIIPWILTMPNGTNLLSAYVAKVDKISAEAAPFLYLEKEKQKRLWISRDNI